MIEFPEASCESLGCSCSICPRPMYRRCCSWFEADEMFDFDDLKRNRIIEAKILISSHIFDEILSNE